MPLTLRCRRVSGRARVRWIAVWRRDLRGNPTQSFPTPFATVAMIYLLWLWFGSYTFWIHTWPGFWSWGALFVDVESQVIPIHIFAINFSGMPRRNAKPVAASPSRKSKALLKKAHQKILIIRWSASHQRCIPRKKMRSKKIENFQQKKSLEIQLKKSQNRKFSISKIFIFHTIFNEKIEILDLENFRDRFSFWPNFFLINRFCPDFL